MDDLADDLADDDPVDESADHGADDVVDGIVAALTEDGYATVPDAITTDRLDTARQELERMLEHTPSGRDDFEGRRTRRVYALFAKTRALDALATHPVVLGVLDRVLGHYQLSAPAAIAIGPGEVAQPLHPDDAIYPMARPHQELVVNVMWPLEEFTEANGATRIVAGSHRWIDERPEADTPTRTVEMPARTALIYLGSVWHGGGANHTDHVRLGVVLHYASAWLRPVENHVLAVPPDMARTLPRRLQELLGYNIYPPFIGYVDGRHPRKLLSNTGAS
jgi:ectoine hydroxylase-related dioxygenase (phytanoyl-CoA dioxygenase family)